MYSTYYHLGLSPVPPLTPDWWGGEGEVRSLKVRGCGGEGGAGLANARYMCTPHTVCRIARRASRDPRRRADPRTEDPTEARVLFLRTMRPIQ
eukprot:scaffold13531_cov119-Isochrysis_galbana.AAC.2